MSKIESVCAMEILDSRGRPTVKATVVLEGSAKAAASVPSGASTGRAEAWELRDGDASRYGGMGCLKAVANVNGPIASALQGQDFANQEALDDVLLKLDGTENKSNLGANAILAVSVAFARACASERGIALYEHFADILGVSVQTQPRLTINLFSGGKHAGKQVPIQDVLIVPVSPKTIGGSLEMMYHIYQAAADLTFERYGMRLLTADEGGLAPPFEDAATMLGTAVEAIEKAGYQPKTDAALAADVASSHFYEQGRYHIGDMPLDSLGMIEQIKAWVARYPIVSVEDGLFEDDWEHWPALQSAIGEQVLVVGDDLLCTNPQRIERAIEAQACNTLLLKVNQIGTLTEAAAAYHLAKKADWKVTISVRSGETEDNWAADLVVGWGGDQFKNGSITQSERLAKYNRLLEIEQEVSLGMIAWPGS